MFIRNAGLVPIFVVLGELVIIVFLGALGSRFLPHILFPRL